MRTRATNQETNNGAEHGDGCNGCACSTPAVKFAKLPGERHNVLGKTKRSRSKNIDGAEETRLDLAQNRKKLVMERHIFLGYDNGPAEAALALLLTQDFSRQRWWSPSTCPVTIHPARRSMC